jgi:hypothetical protein
MTVPVVGGWTSGWSMPSCSHSTSVRIKLLACVFRSCCITVFLPPLSLMLIPTLNLPPMLIQSKFQIKMYAIFCGYGHLVSCTGWSCTALRQTSTASQRLH